MSSPDLSLLMTGATGMVGSTTLAHLLRLGVHCSVLVRSKHGHSPASRLESILRRFETAWAARLPRPDVFDFDLVTPEQGADARLLKRQAGRWDAMLHCAANLSFAPASQSPCNEPYRTNVGGTESVLSLVRDLKIPRLHHVSTAYVCGQREGRVFENENDIGQSFANDYEHSKSIAESKVTKAAAECWFDTLTIYRPSIVIDRSGLAPVSNDRTIHGAFSMYQSLAARFGLPNLASDESWFGKLGFGGLERKNLVEVDWVARVIAAIIHQPKWDGRTIHLTAIDGTSIKDLETAFQQATSDWLTTRSSLSGKNTNGSVFAQSQTSGEAKPKTAPDPLARAAEPFVATFLPYFRDDPTFDRRQIDEVITGEKLPPPPVIGTDAILEIANRWAGASSGATKRPHPIRPIADKQVPSSRLRKPFESSATDNQPAPNAGDLGHARQCNDDVVICGFDVRLPGHVNGIADFEELLFDGRSAIEPMPVERLDRSLYFDARRQMTGKTYSDRGGCVDDLPPDSELQHQIDLLGRFDVTHTQLAHVAASALRHAFGDADVGTKSRWNPNRAGVFVGHSGGTRDGGPLAMATLADEAVGVLEDTDVGQKIGPATRNRLRQRVAEAIRSNRPTSNDR
ncbi:MAG: SDR family oxidoreductase, partial [Planctomycetota bacterium]